jgi:hypothetical protein
MADILKGLAALVVVCAAYKYAAERMVKKAIEVAQNGGEGYELEFKPLEFPETNFDWNRDWTVRPEQAGWDGQ